MSVKCVVTFRDKAAARIAVRAQRAPWPVVLLLLLLTHPWRKAQPSRNTSS